MGASHGHEAVEEARRTVAAAVHHGDAGRFDELVALFCADATFEIVGQVRHEGRAAIAAMFARGGEHLAAAGPVPRIRHHLSSQLIEWDGPDRLRSSSYWVALMDAGVDHWGRYVDHLVPEGGRWRFSLRRVLLDGAVPGGWGARGREWTAGEGG